MLVARLEPIGATVRHFAHPRDRITDAVSGVSVNFPVLAKCAFPGFVLALLAASAFLLARGVSALLETALLVDVAELTRYSGRAHAEKPPNDADSDADALLRRNPFDSVTGSLLKEPGEIEAEPPPPPLDPLNAPVCREVDVYSTIVSTDPLWSSAVIQGPGEARGHVRRVGDVVGSRQLAFVGRNPVARSPAVWLVEDATLCQALLFDGSPRRAVGGAKPPPAPPPPPPAPAAPPPKMPRPQAALPPDLAAKIRKVSATEFLVDRSAIDRIMADYAGLVRGSRMRPVKNNGAVSGFRLARIGQQTLLGQLGLLDGDVIQAINGFPLTAPDKALRAYASLRTASELRVQLLRGGRGMTIDYRIR
jgi:general secretion pathway protein C